MLQQLILEIISNNTLKRLFLIENNILKIEVQLHYLKHKTIELDDLNEELEIDQLQEVIYLSVPDFKLIFNKGDINTIKFFEKILDKSDDKNKTNFNPNIESLISYLLSISF